MKRFSKALGGGLGGILAAVAVQAVKHYIPDMDSALVTALIAAVVPGITVYAAPANAPH